MKDKLARVFWLTTIVAVPVAYLTEPGLWRWVAIAWFGIFGVSVALGNWAILLRSREGGRHVSLVPLLGGALLLLALGAVPVKLVSRSIIWGCLLDPWLAVLAISPFWVLGSRIKRRLAGRRVG
jgi:hypothetical protein